MEQITCKRGECWFEDIETTLGSCLNLQKRIIKFWNVFWTQNSDQLKAVLELASLLKEKNGAAILDKETLKLVPVKNIHVYFG